MTIRKGSTWGVDVDRPVDLVVASDDAELAGRTVADGPPLAVREGDLARTLGVRDLERPRLRRVPIDRLHVRLDHVETVAVANVVARRSWWRGRVVVVANAQFLGRWDVAPRSHPNDGRADTVDVDPAMPLRQRILAWRRLPTGTHVPHPQLRQRRIETGEWDFDPPLDVRVDGRRHRRVRHLAVRVEPDAFELHV